MLENLFDRASKALTKPKSASRKLSTGISHAIMNVAGASGLATMPGAAQKAFQLSIDPNAEARDFVDVIESDEGLSARVIKIANSVYYDRGQGSKTIEQSVVVIGLEELKCLLSATTLSEIFPTKHPARAQLWANDIATALLAKTLCGRILPGKEEIAFLGGLMHDVGKLFLLQRATPQYEEIMNTVKRLGGSFSNAETTYFPFDHTEAGQLIGEKWNFSEDLIDIIRNHHRGWEEFDPKHPTLAGLIKAADLIAHSMGLGHPDDFSKFRKGCEGLLGGVWSYLNVQESEQRELLQSLKQKYEQEYDLYAGAAH